MINLLGPKKIAVIVILLVLNIGAAFTTYSYFTPIGAKMKKQIRTITAETRAKQADIEQLRRETTEIVDQKSFYDDLEKIGFFSDQNRIEARRNIEDIQRISRALRVQYDMKPAEVIPNTISEDSGYVFLDTPVSINIDVIDDADLYKFIYWIQASFPGHVSFRKISVKRKLDVNEANLKKISDSNPQPMVSGIVEFRWKTMIVKEGAAAPDSAPASPAGGKK